MPVTGRVTLGSGPWQGVYSHVGPYAPNSERYLWDLTNGYVVPSPSGSSVLGRPGFTRPTSVSTSTAGQGWHTHLAGDGTRYNFLFRGGKVYRVPNDLSSAPVDVTPTNIVQGTGKFVYAVSLAGEMIVSDGVNKPWRGSALGSTPITATVIEQQTPANVLSRAATDTRLANAAFTYTHRSGGSLGQQASWPAATTILSGLGADGTIPAGLWGSFLVELNTGAGVFVVTPATGNDTGYASETLALAGLPARTATSWYVGHFTVLASGGAAWIANTDALAGGATGNPAQATNYYAGEGPAWSAYGPPVIYTGSVFFLGKQIATAYARTTITWSEPNEPGVGYQQTDYDNAWTLTQTSAEPLYTLAATNRALYYFRATSTGTLVGAPGINFQGTATHDTVAGVGTTSPASVKVFGEQVWFPDEHGKPWMIRGGSAVPVWQANPRVYVEEGVPDGARYIEAHGWAAIEPNLHLYLSFVSSADSGPTICRVFDVRTGDYFGQWQIGGGVGLDIGGTVYDSNGKAYFIAAQTVSGGVGYHWLMSRPGALAYTDNAAEFPVTAAFWLGASASRLLHIDEVRVDALVAGVDAEIGFTVSGSDTASTPSSDIPVTYWAPSTGGRVVYRADIRGRAINLYVAMKGQGAKRLDRLEIEGSASTAAPSDR